MADWNSGQYLKFESERTQSAFEAALLARIEAAFSTLSNGTVLFPFPRLFFTAAAK